VKFENMVLTGTAIRRLMRKHGATLRGIKAQHQITLKRTREVRQSGVRGFLAAEWFWIITGRWPDDSAAPAKARPNARHPVDAARAAAMNAS